jgi:hypothetical protein
MIFSVSCIIAIAFTVGRYNGDPIPSLPSGVTLNALISILSTAARAALFFVVSSSIGQLKWCCLVQRGTRLQDIQLMDEASRGPLGAIKVLAKWTGGPLSTLGAAITVCMIAFSPFLQQLVAYPTELAEQPSLEATAPNAVNSTFLAEMWWGGENGTTNFGDWWNVYRAFGPEAFAPRVTCPRPAVNCEWDYKSVGWCSKCKKTTGRLSDCVVKDHNSSSASFCQLIVDNPETEAVRRPGLMQHVVRNSPSKTLGGVSVADSIRYATEHGWAANVSQFVAEDGTIVENPVITLTQAAISRVEDVFADLYHSDQPALHVEFINECAMTICEREYSAAIVDGEFSWNLVSIDYGKRFQSGSCWRPEDSAGDVVLKSHDGGLTHLNETERAFCPIDGWFDVFKSAAINNAHYWTYNLTHSWRDPDDVPLEPLEDITGSRGIPSFAAALTNYGLNISNHNAVGKAYLPEIKVRARWRWIVLPAFLELASVVLFLLTVFYSRQIKVPVWKSSLLAICYHKIEDLPERRDVTLVSEMDQASSTAFVQISRSGDDREFMLRRFRSEERQEGRDQV